MNKRNLKSVNTPGGAVIGYCRLSSTAQLQRSGDYSSLEAQAQQIREYCHREHPDWLPYLEVVQEVKSARDTNRPELQKILQRVHQ